MTGSEKMIEMLEYTKGVGGPLETVTIHLIKDDYTPSPTDTIATVAEHEADYTGYAPSAALTWLEAYVTADGAARLPARSVQFIPTGTAITNFIYGYYLQTGTAGTAKLAQFRRLASPLPMMDVFNSLIVNPEIVFPQTPV